MKVLVVGGGGREHAIIKAMKRGYRELDIYAAPGNGGIAADAVCTGIGAKDIAGIVEFAKKENMEFAVVAPDDPLVMGAVDALEAVGIPCFGPRKNAAIIEGSKVFSKELMKKYGIPTAEYAVFSDMDRALEYIETASIPVVVKADGLALGKGVIIAETKEAAKKAVINIMRDKVFGASGSSIVVEEFLTGPEVSVLAFTDGKTLKPMVSSMDHKRALDGDEGLNTGGMGTVAPNPYYTDDIAKKCMEEIFIPTVEAMAKEGRPFSGCLYFGLMLTEKGPKVIEYNCRFGDPETQVVLPLLKSDLMDIMIAVSKGELASCPVEFADGCACCVVMSSRGYPEKYDTGFEIISDITDPDTEIYIAGAKLEADKLLSAGGRVLGVTAVAKDLEHAVEKAYAGVSKVHFDNAFYRNDIGKRALAARK